MLYSLTFVASQAHCAIREHSVLLTMQQSIQVKGCQPFHLGSVADFAALLALVLDLGALIAEMIATGNALPCSLIRVTPRA